MADDLGHFIDVFSALGDPTRLEMLRLIDQAGEMPCTTLVNALGVAKSTVSYHVKVLAHAKLITVRKEGRNYFYTPRRDDLDEVVPGFRRRLGRMRTSGTRRSAA